MKKLFSVEAGGFGGEVLWLVERINKISFAWEIEKFPDGNKVLHKTLQDEYPVLGRCTYLKNLDIEIYVVVTMRSAIVKRNVIEKLAEYKYVYFATLIIINMDCTIGYDAVIGDHATIYTNINIFGNVIVGKEVESGTGAQIIQGKNIGTRTIIRAGTVVISDIGDYCTTVGNPAKVVKLHKDEAGKVKSNVCFTLSGKYPVRKMCSLQFRGVA